MTRPAGTPDSAATVPSMPGVIAGRYSIDRELGRGAMGRVFAAHDAKLDRDVAIKVLAPGARGEEELRRFEQEARAAGSLNHPNVVAVYDIGVHGGEPYIVSELLEGAPLRERLGGKPLPAALVIDLASQLAEGLAAAHDKGVIHRDLKPENLFVTRGGRLKILDFGIAKLTRAAPSVPQTDTGTVMGTVGYMSPEQVRGEHVDARSDLFSFGCILYEMLAGRAPFDRPSSMETGSAILHDEPPQTVPRELDPVLRRCLEKDPARRYPSAHELLLALARVRPPAAPRWRWIAGAMALAVLIAAGLLVPRLRAAMDAKGARSIAVLPFVNMSSDKENEYFSDGITEELINALANVEGLRVASRTAVFAIKGQNLDVPKLGARLNADTLLEGSVRREGSTLRVTAQLINVSDGYHLWSQSYDRELKSVFAVEDEIAR